MRFKRGIDIVKVRSSWWECGPLDHTYKAVPLIATTEDSLGLRNQRARWAGLCADMLTILTFPRANQAE